MDKDKKDKDPKPKKKYEPKLKVNATFGDLTKAMINAKPKDEDKSEK